VNTTKKELEGALKRLVESTSNYVQDDIWYVALMLDIQNAALVLGDDATHDWVEECLEGITE
jgi:hypothetical protein